MSPVFIKNNHAHSSLVNPKSGSNGCLAYFATNIHFSYFYHLVFGKFCSSYRSSNGVDSLVFSPFYTSSFFGHIAHVFGVRCLKKMIWIYAGGIITAMANGKTGFNFSVMNFKRHAMSFCVSTVVKCLTIPPAILRSFPCPAIIGFFNFTPKTVKLSFGKIDRWSLVWNTFCRFIHGNSWLSLAISSAEYTGDGVFIIA